MIEEALAKGKSTLETVLDMRWWSDTLFTFTITKPAGFSFVPGQYARLGLPGAHDMIWRAYSMVSAPREDRLEFYGILVPGGRFTALVKELRPGARILLEKQPFGFMTVNRFPDGDELWMLATGTGIGPFISILRDPHVWQAFRRLILVHGVRHAGELAYRDELSALCANPPSSSTRLQLLQAVTREPTVPPLLAGRITTLLESGELERAAGIPLTEKSSRIMMCGNPDMIEDTRHILHRRGMRPCRRALPGQFVTENYW